MKKRNVKKSPKRSSKSRSVKKSRSSTKIPKSNLPTPNSKKFNKNSS